MSKIFVQFWFCAFSETTKSCLTLKIIPSNLPGKILSFESISVVISQKLSELDQFNIGPFLFPRTVDKKFLSGFTIILKLDPPVVSHFFWGMYNSIFATINNTWIFLYLLLVWNKSRSFTKIPKKFIKMLKKNNKWFLLYSLEKI